MNALTVAATAAAAADTAGAEQIAFWVLAPLALLGADITDSTNTREPSGQIVNTATLADTLYLLFEVRLEAAEHNRLVLGDENGPPITLLTIPYSLDKPALA